MKTQALRWTAQAVGNSRVIRSVFPLAGATSSAVYGVDVLGKTGLISLVLRLFDNAEWLAAEPDLARHEAWGLQTAQKALVPTPELVAFDETGEHCGLPAVLMTRLPGNVELQPPNRQEWLREMAEAIASVHQIDAEDAPWCYASYNDLAQLEPPVWSSRPENWTRAIEIVHGPKPQCPTHFIHRDYHPNNVLWSEGKVTGIVDWPNSCRGAAGIDVAWCRQNLAQLHGLVAADAFLTAYQTAAGNAFAYHPYWDLMAVIEFLPGPPGMYPGWTAHGIRHLTAEIVRDRIEDYLGSILARC